MCTGVPREVLQPGDRGGRTGGAGDDAQLQRGIRSQTRRSHLCGDGQVNGFIKK